LKSYFEQKAICCAQGLGALRQKLL